MRVLLTSMDESERSACCKTVGVNNQSQTQLDVLPKKRAEESGFDRLLLYLSPDQTMSLDGFIPAVNLGYFVKHRAESGRLSEWSEHKFIVCNLRWTSGHSI
jgi:hypothetical protein